MDFTSVQKAMAAKEADSDTSISHSRTSSVSVGHKAMLSNEVRNQFLDTMLNAMTNKRFSQKLVGDKEHSLLEHAWIFLFVDIIFVATLFKISHLIGVCGKGADVYLMAFSYYSLMFSTRQAFDVYTCVSGANGILHVIAFAVYGMGVFIMTVNIASHRVSTTSESHRLLLGDAVMYGECERTKEYDIAFAAAFIFTRLVLMVMYALYFFVFHESNALGRLPDMGEKGVRLSDLTVNRESDMSQLRQMSVQRPVAGLGLGGLGLGGMGGLGGEGDESPRGSIQQDDKGGKGIGMGAVGKGLGVGKGVGFDCEGGEGGEDPMQNMNPLYMTGDLRHSFVLRVTHNFRDSVIQKHFSRIFLLKISPLILSSLAMLFIFLEFSPLVVLPIVAGIEFVGDFLPDLVVSSVADWKELNPTSEFAEERLGLLFMLVLGEAVLGFSSINYDPSRTAQIYQTLTFSFFTIFTIGMQYFEPLQEYTKPMGQHPLSIKGLSPIYVWLIALTSFLMLVAANGMTELYYYVSNHEENNLADVTYQEEKVSTCLASVVVLMLVLKVLDKVYYREKLLPFGWLDSLYEPSTQDPRASELTEHNEGTGGGGRESRIRVVAKSEVAVGIRKIKPLTAVKLCAAAFLLVMWRFKLSPGAFMMWVTGVVVFPNLVEVILEIRQFFVAEGAIRKKRQISIASIQSHVSQSVQSLELKKAVDKSNSVPPTPPLA